MKLGPMANVRDLAEQLWPIGSGMTVHYDPAKPHRSYVDSPVFSSFTCTIFIVAGLAMIAIGVTAFFLIQL